MINKKLKIGNIEIKNAVLLAPMEGITDLPFRIICKELGADIVYTEFVASEALIRDVPKSFRKIVLDERERPVSIQIFGNNPERMALAAKIAEEEGADFVDINYGCWVKKVVNNNAGSALMKFPELMAEITNKCVNATNIPITIKTRLGWDENNINIFEIAKMQEAAGASAITVHCRTRSQKITGAANWNFIPQIKENINIPLILNGDILSSTKALEAMQIQGADAIMIARGAVGNPFIFRETKQKINDFSNEINSKADDKINSENSKAEITIRERIDFCIKHLSLNLELKGEHGLIEFRKHYSGYLRGMFDASSVRQKLVIAKNFEEIIFLLNDYYDFLEKNERLAISNNYENRKVKLSKNLFD
jgi:tRNA-dihydrouridine synthase B